MIKYTAILSSLVLMLGFAHDALATEKVENPTKIELYGGALSYHFDTDKDLNNVNPLVIATYDDWATGYFYNSYKENSFMVGRNFYLERKEQSPVVLGVILGAVTGYNKNQVPMCFTDGFCPMVMPYIQWHYGNWKPTIIFGGAFVSAAVGYEF
ncbi:antimicrobial peptide resistance and lipid A acylation protein PagP [Vibrio phage River4]|uniref:Uncharacterized protein n=1 Tax=Vibrio phage River4 TaxID=2736288 RepID=A0A6M9Z245_9CAUD|nr:antimicrobial peptide resistance and lipid A acylation protein PagP [Vibrio phage River4]QKN84814.1 hypothetical protein RIVER4_175 [Vibrio phage River4]